MSLSFDNVRLALGENRWHLDITLATHGVYALFGRSGSGKSTLLSLIGGFQQPDQGRISWHEHSLLELSPAARPVTTLFQHDNLFAHLNVFDNVALGLSPTLRLSAEERARVRTGLADVGLSGFGDRKPASLSGGERQRVGLARCLLRAKPILLLDEPFGALDAQTRTEVIALTRAVIERARPCVIMVTHDEEDAADIGAEVLELVDGEVMRLEPPV